MQLTQLHTAIDHVNRTTTITFPQRGGSDVGPVTSDVREDGPTAHLHHNTSRLSLTAERRSTYPFIA